MRDHAYDYAVIADDELDLLFSQASPNPDRVGCPPREVLADHVRNRRPIDDPIYVHLARCSECYVKVRALQQSAESPNRLVGSVVRWMMVAAAIILTTGVGIWLVDRSGDNRIDQQGGNDIAAGRGHHAHRD